MKILPDESAGSFAFRVAQTRRQSLTLFCLEQFDLSNLGDLDRILVRDYGHALERIGKTIHKAHRSLHLEEEYTYSVWSRETRKYTGPIRACPYCLAEEKYGRKFWRTKFAAACPRHEVELIGACPFCRANLPYFGEMAGIVGQFWLESWPTCPTCLRVIECSRPAHPVLLAMTRRWTSSFAGNSQCSYTAHSFLHLSYRILSRFDADDRYRQLAALVASESAWPHQLATALLLRALLRKQTSPIVAYAALGLTFQPDQLANEIVVCPRTKAPRSLRPV